MDKDKNPIFEMKDALKELSKVVEIEAKQKCQELLNLKEQLPDMIKNHQRLETQKGAEKQGINFNPMIDFNPENLDKVNEQLNAKSKEFMSQISQAQEQIKEFDENMKAKFLSTEGMRKKFEETISDDIIPKEERKTDYEKKKEEIMERLKKRFDG